MPKKSLLPPDLDLDRALAAPGAGRPPPPLYEVSAPQTTTEAPDPEAAPPPPLRKTTDLKRTAIATTFYLLPDDHRRLRRLAADKDVAAQTLLLDALDMLLEREGHVPVQRWEPRRKIRS
jgi:hypothetical protein